MIEILEHSATELLDRCGGYLEAHEAEHNLALGILIDLCSRAPDETSPTLLRLSDDGRTVGVAIRTPPHNLVVSRIDGDTYGAMSALVGRIGSPSTDIPGVIGPVSETEAFASMWHSAGYAHSKTIGMEQGVYELRAVHDVGAAPGTFRAAARRDRDLLTEWSLEFARLIESPVPEDAIAERVVKHIDQQQLFVWDDNGPVSMAASVRATRRGITVNGVYTPLEFRNRGYATSCVHDLSAYLLDCGHEFCALYTDLANPTSNGIYRRIGYRKIAESRLYRFEP